MDFNSEIALETFINMCDELMIPAEEGLFRKSKISINKARDVKTESEMKSRMYGEEPLIHLVGDDAHLLKNIFKKMKKSGTWNSVAAGINSANGYGTAAYLQQKEVNSSGQGDAMKYKLVEKDGESYLLHKKYVLD